MKKKVHCFKIKKGEKRIIFLRESGEYKIELLGEGAEAEILGVFIGKGEEYFEIKTSQLHQAPNTKSNLLIKGVLFNKASLSHQGRIHIAKKAHKASAYQKTETLLASEEASSQAKPELEILAPDVSCSHSSTVGRIEERQLFYLTSRGITKKEALKMALRGFVRKGLGDELIKKLTLEIESKLESL
jgi:Fe-S cluster assembly protein SufD